MSASRRSPRAPRGAFTLVEVMIVATIIGVVATLALPNLLAARTEAEVAQLHADVETIRKAWATLLASGGLQLDDPSLRLDPAAHDSEPAALTPLLGTLGRGEVSFPTRGPPGGPQYIDVKTRMLVGPRGITFTTKVQTIGRSSSRLPADRLPPEGTWVVTTLHANGGPATEVLRGVRRRLLDEGHRATYVESRDAFATLVIYTRP